ncbi:MAG: DUF4917 family protein [Endomicrobiaceae bacterium]
MYKILTFNEVNKEITSGSHKKLKNLLLGNGFSIAFNKSFSYKNLYKKAVQNDKKAVKNGNDKNEIFTKDIKKIFNKNGSDFEKVMEAMKASGSSDNQINKIRNVFVQTNTSVHPKDPYAIETTQYDSNYKFLSDYDNIYTTNYDLLLNWVITKKAVGSFSEGFKEDGDKRYLWHKENYNSKKKIFYLHGCLALFYEQKALIMKRFQDYENKKKFEHILEEMLKNAEFPLFVAEGSSNNKKNKIEKDDYLKNAYENFEKMSGSLVTYGFGFNENDNHIIDAILRSQVECVYIGLYDLNSIRKLEEKLLQDNNDNKTIKFYDASVKIW